MCTSWWTGSLTWAPSVQPVLFCRSPQGLKPTKDNTVRSFNYLPSVRLWESSLDDLWGRLSLRHKRNLTLVKPVCETAPKSFFGSHLRTSIWVRAIIGLLKKPFTIFCQSELKEIQNAFPVIHLVRLGPIRIKENSKRIPGSSFSPFGANQN